MRPDERLVSDQTDSPDLGSTIQYSVRVREPCRAGRIATYVAHIRDRIEKTGGTSAPAPRTDCICILNTTSPQGARNEKSTALPRFVRFGRRD